MKAAKARKPTRQPAAAPTAADAPPAPVPMPPRRRLFLILLGTAVAWVLLLQFFYWLG